MTLNKHQGVWLKLDPTDRMDDEIISYSYSLEHLNDPLVLFLEDGFGKASISDHLRDQVKDLGCFSKEDEYYYVIQAPNSDVAFLIHLTGAVRNKSKSLNDIWGVYK